MADSSHGLLTFLADNMSSQSPAKRPHSSQNADLVEPVPIARPSPHQYQSLPNTNSLSNKESAQSHKESVSSHKESHEGESAKTSSLRRSKSRDGSLQHPSGPHQSLPASKPSNNTEELKPQSSPIEEAPKISANGQKSKKSLSRSASSSGSPVIEQRRRSIRLKRTKSKSSVSLGDLLLHGLLEVGQSLIYKGEEGFLLKNGWIEYGPEPFSEISHFVKEVLKEKGKLNSFNEDTDYWPDVIVRADSLSDSQLRQIQSTGDGVTLSTLRDIFLSEDPQRRTRGKPTKQMKDPSSSEVSEESDQNEESEKSDQSEESEEENQESEGEESGEVKSEEEEVEEESEYDSEKMRLEEAQEDKTGKDEEAYDGEVAEDPMDLGEGNRGREPSDDENDIFSAVVQKTLKPPEKPVARSNKKDTTPMKVLPVMTKSKSHLKPRTLDIEAMDIEKPTQEKSKPEKIRKEDKSQVRKPISILSDDGEDFATPSRPAVSQQVLKRKRENEEEDHDTQRTLAQRIKRHKHSDKAAPPPVEEDAIEPMDIVDDKPLKRQRSLDEMLLKGKTLPIILDKESAPTQKGKTSPIGLDKEPGSTQKSEMLLKGKAKEPASTQKSQAKPKLPKKNSDEMEPPKPKSVIVPLEVTTSPALIPKSKTSSQVQMPPPPLRTTSTEGATKWRKKSNEFNPEELETDPNPVPLMSSVPPGYLTQEENRLDRLENLNTSPLDQSPIEEPTLSKSRSKEAPKEPILEPKEKPNEKKSRAKKPVMTTQPFISPPLGKIDESSINSSAETQLPRRKSLAGAVVANPVIFSSGLDSKKISQLAVAKSRLGCEILSDYAESATHLIVTAKNDNVTARTIKYLLALLSGVYVVKFDWIMASLAAQSWVDVGPFLIAGDSFAVGAPEKVRREIETLGMPALFKGLSFYFAPGPYSKSAPDLKSLKEIVQLAGCEAVLEAPPSPPRSHQELYQSNVVLISDSDLPPDRINEEFLRLGRKLVDYKWILNSLSKYEVEPLETYSIPKETLGIAIQTQQSAEF